MIGLQLRTRSTWIAVAIAIVVIVAVFAAVAGLWSAVGNADISAGGWIAMGFGVLAALGLGIGLMALVFFSARHGYDELDGDRR